MRILLSISLVLFGNALLAQTPKQWESYGDKSKEEGDHYGAAIYYHKAVVIDEDNPALWLKYGMELKAYNDYDRAEEAFQAAWDKHLLMDQQVSQFWLATMQKHNGHYRKAFVNFDDFYQNYPNRTSFLVQKAKQEAISCRWAMSHQTDSSNFKLENVEDAVSSEYSEFSPYLMPDRSLLFTSLRFQKKSNGQELMKEDEDQKIWLYKALWKDSAWEEVVAFDTVLNPEHQNFGNACPSPDGKRMYYSLCDDHFNCSIWKAELAADGSWGNAEPLNTMVNEAGSNNTQAQAVEIDGKEILFFSSNRLRGRGGMDIWYSTYDERRKAFSKPRNMGKNVNTSGDEICPFWLADSNHLYFSSDWHEGYGGFDVFMTKGTLNSLYRPKNMGLGINTSANDLYFKRFSEQGLSFLTSNRKGSISLKGQTCCNDIYMAKEIPIEKVEVVKEPDPVVLKEEKLEEELEVVKDLLPLSLYFHNDQPNPRSWSTTTDLSYKEAFGDYHSMLEEYVTANRHIAKHHETDSMVEATRLFFKEDVEGGINKLDQVMEMVKHQLTSGHQIELTIKGFASPLARSDYNHNLTERRIMSLVNYFERYDDGFFMKYISAAEGKAQLILKEEPFGESTAATHISDDRDDHRRSVYGLTAAKERRIEIIRINQLR